MDVSVLFVSHPQVHPWNECRMSSTFVTLAEVLEARGGPLLEEEVWSLLVGTAEALIDVSYKGKDISLTAHRHFHPIGTGWIKSTSHIFAGHNNMSNIISPTSLLLSATGTLAFKNCGLSDDVSTFTAPEMLQGRASSTKPAIERVGTEAHFMVPCKH